MASRSSAIVSFAIAFIPPNGIVGLGNYSYRFMLVCGAYYSAAASAGASAAGASVAGASAAGASGAASAATGASGAWAALAPPSSAMAFISGAKLDIGD